MKCVAGGCHCRGGSRPELASKDRSPYHVPNTVLTRVSEVHDQSLVLVDIPINAAAEHKKLWCVMLLKASSIIKCARLYTTMILTWHLASCAINHLLHSKLNLLKNSKVLCWLLIPLPPPSFTTTTRSNSITVTKLFLLLLSFLQYLTSRLIKMTKKSDRIRVWYMIYEAAASSSKISVLLWFSTAPTCVLVE